MTPEAQAMIEKAARAIYEHVHGIGTWDDEGRIAREVYTDYAEAALTAVFPGILAGTHAELPIEPTDEMEKIFLDSETHAGYVWMRMVDAYLEEKAG